jgi:hypothetical protein
MRHRLFMPLINIVVTDFFMPVDCMSLCADSYMHVGKFLVDGMPQGVMMVCNQEIEER